MKNHNYPLIFHGKNLSTEFIGKMIFFKGFNLSLINISKFPRKYVNLMNFLTINGAIQARTISRPLIPVWMYGSAVLYIIFYLTCLAMPTSTGHIVTDSDWLISEKSAFLVTIIHRHTESVTVTYWALHCTEILHRDTAQRYCTVIRIYCTELHRNTPSSHLPISCNIVWIKPSNLN